MTAILKVRDKQTGEFVSIPAIKGDTGATPNIALSVTMLEENAEPTVDTSGTAENPIITIGIPSGHVFTFEDFSPEQIELLQQPAIDAAVTANSAASNANTQASTANEKAILADQKATAANNAAIAATTAANSANTAADAASEAVNTVLSSTVATQQANGLMSAADKIKLDTSTANKDLSNVSFVDKSLSGAFISDCKVTKDFDLGYYKAPDGLMIEWGVIGRGSGFGTLQFPMAFYGKPFSVVASATMPTNATNSAISLDLTTMSNTKVTWKKTYNGGNSSYGEFGESANWIAIGKWK